MVHVSKLSSVHYWQLSTESSQMDWHYLHCPAFYEQSLVTEWQTRLQLYAYTRPACYPFGCMVWKHACSCRKIYRSLRPLTCAANVPFFCQKYCDPHCYQSSVYSGDYHQEAELTIWRVVWLDIHTRAHHDIAFYAESAVKLEPTNRHALWQATTAQTDSSPNPSELLLLILLAPRSSALLMDTADPRQYNLRHSCWNQRCTFDITYPSVCLQSSVIHVSVVMLCSERQKMLAKQCQSSCTTWH